ncbi:hypothetical protein OC846_005362 [Tilletia horrida]|uniref:Uncharacterized protein n=1 Tax=Tilletia horrida TaxID=155126 RepID=A0AAN6JW25_9BASI|nr:hypothetical protein OC846_005362 [Tilletia horrida]KAK0563754.1 hypothetical protein OC861_004653 [Tilletia horrida]
MLCLRQIVFLTLFFSCTLAMVSAEAKGFRREVVPTPDPVPGADPGPDTKPYEPAPTVPKGTTKPPTDPKEPTKPPTDPKEPTTVPGTTYTLTAQDVAKDNSTALLNIGALGNIAALGTFNSTSGIRWTPQLLEVGYVAKVNETNTLGGGYTINATHISVGAGIGFNGAGVSFSLLVDKKGPVTGQIGGNGFKCTLSENNSKAVCTK